MRGMGKRNVETSERPNVEKSKRQNGEGCGVLNREYTTPQMGFGIAFAEAEAFPRCVPRLRFGLVATTSDISLHSRGRLCYIRTPSAGRCIECAAAQAI